MTTVSGNLTAEGASAVLALVQCRVGGPALATPAPPAGAEIRCIGQGRRWQRRAVHPVLPARVARAAGSWQTGGAGHPRQRDQVTRTGGLLQVP